MNPVRCSGNAAVARGAHAAGVQVVAAYPGSPVTDLTEAFATLAGTRARWLANEKVALEFAAGVSYAGARVLAVMKHVGLNVAADALYNLAYTGVAGGLVIAVGDDPGARSSQNEQDTRAVAAAANVPVLEPADVAEAYVFARLAFSISERFDVPVILRLTTALCYSSGSLIFAEQQPPRPAQGFAAPVEKYLLLPRHVPARHRALVQNLRRLAASDWARAFCVAEFPSNDDSRRRWPLGLVCSGYPSGVIRELLGERLPVLRIGMPLPLQEDAVRAFAARCERLLVLEECSPFLEQRLRALGLPLLERVGFEPIGELDLQAVLAQVAPDLPPPRGTGPSGAVTVRIPSVEGRLDIVDLPNRAPGFCSGCPHVPVFVALSRRGLYVVGDIGCYTMGAKPPFNALHQNLCMGASLGLLQGYLSVMEPAARQRAVAVIGDSTFFHSGLPALLSAARENLPGTILILDNSGSAMTGLQLTGPQLADAEWDTLLGGLGVADRAVVPAFALARIERELDRALAADGLSVIVVKGDCVQNRSQSRPTNYRYSVLTERCTECRECFKTDCPSIAWRPDRSGRMRIDIAADCVGCGLCAQVCPDQAIVPLGLARTPRWVARPLAGLPWHDLIRGARGIPPLRRLIDWLERDSPA